MQNDVDKDMTATADTVEHVMGDIGMAHLSKAFRVRSFSLGVGNTHEVELDCKLSAKTVV